MNRPSCKKSHLGPQSKIKRTGWWRYLLQADDHSGNDPHLVPGFFFRWIRGCSRNGSRLQPQLWIQKEFVQIRQSTQKSTPCPTELLRQFLCHPSFYLFRHLSDILLVNSINGSVAWLTAPKVSFVIFLSKRCQLFFVQ